MRARGLKPCKQVVYDPLIHVAPHAGAWIETIRGILLMYYVKKSRPMRARGLKLDNLIQYIKPGWVAPHAGAWIETFKYHCAFNKSCVAPHAGAWIETEEGYSDWPEMLGRRAPCGRVD